MTDELYYYANIVFTGNYRMIADLEPVIRNINPVNKMELKMKNIICKSQSDFFLEKLFEHINY